MNVIITNAAEQAIGAMWDFLYGHQTECSEYVPGKRLTDEDECGCEYEWDSETVEIVADMITRALPEHYLRHRAQPMTLLVGAYGSKQVERHVPACLCGWTETGQERFYASHGAALSATLRLHLDAIPIRLHV